MNENPERINWVMQMHNCMIERVLDIIFDQVRIDVTERQKLTSREDGIAFTVDDLRSEKRMFVVKKVSICEGSEDLVPMDKVQFSCTRDDKQDYIAAEQNGSVLKITRRWNAETASCDYFVGGKTAAPWQISNAALKTLFFDSGRTP